MEVIVQDASNIVIEVDQGRSGRGIEDIGLITVGADYYLLFTFTDGTTEQVGPIAPIVTEVLFAEVRNAEAVTINKGQPVYLYQAQGNLATVKLAYNTSDATSAKTLGLAAEDIAPGAQGLVTCQGTLGGLNTGAYNEGDTLYLGAAAGTLTNVKPQAPNHLVYIGVVERANNGAGQIYVRVQNGYELDEIHDVRIVSPVNGNTLIYDASTSLWKNAGITAGSGVSITNGPASITVGNTGVLSFSGGTTGLTPSAASTGAVSLAGTLAVANGGTGQTTANAALNALLPAQTSQSGKYLKTDGSNASWDQLDISTADITGTLPVANGGTGVTTSTGTGSVVLSNSPALTTPNLGTPSAATLTNATGLPLSTGVTGTLAASNGGTGQSSYTAGDLIYATGSTALAKLGIGASTNVLTSSGSAPQWTAASSVAIGTATNLAGGTSGSVPYQSGAGATTFLGIGAANSVMTSSGTAPQWSSSLTLGGTLAVNGNTTLGDASTDTVQVNGYIGVGGAGSSDRALFIRSTALTGVNQYGLLSDIEGNSAATSLVSGVHSRVKTAATAFTTNSVVAFYAVDAVKGAGSTITNQHGLYIADQTQGTNDFGITSLVTSGTNKWNIYASGTAANYFAGNVLLNTTTSLSTWTAGNSARLQIAGSSAYGALSVMSFGTVNPVHSGAVVLGKSRGAVGVLAETLSGDSLGFVSFEGVNSSSTSIGGAYIRATQTAAASATNIPAALQFFTSTGAADPTERMRLNSNGNVGIGTSSPEARLDARISSNTVYSTSAINTVVADFRNESTTDGTPGAIQLTATGSGSVGIVQLAAVQTASASCDFTIGVRQSATFAERARFTGAGNIKIAGTATRATTEGTNHLDIFNGTAPVGTLTNGISIYSSSGEAYVMDAAGNATLFSPHDANTNEWIFKSKHTPTGKVLKIDVERLLRFVNDHFGLDAVQEFIEE